MLGPESAQLTDLETLFSRLVQISVVLGFIALTVVLILAGIKYITSGGQAKSIESAKQTITWGILGMLFFVIAWIALQLIGAVTGVHVTTFCLDFAGCP